MGIVVFSIFYVFISAFEGKRELYWKSFLVFLTITMPFLLVGHVLSWIMAEFVNTASFLTSILHWN